MQWLEKELYFYTNMEFDGNLSWWYFETNMVVLLILYQTYVLS